MSAAVDACVIRTQRNKERKPVSADLAATCTLSKSEDSFLEAGDELEYQAQSKLRMVRPPHYLGYVSTLYAFPTE